MYIDFHVYPPYSGAISENFVTNFNANIQCDHGYDHSSSKEKIAHGLIKKVGHSRKSVCLMLSKKNMPENNNIQKCTYLQMIEIKLMRVFISPQIMKIPFLHHIFMKNL